MRRETCVGVVDSTGVDGVFRARRLVFAGGEGGAG